MENFLAEHNLQNSTLIGHSMGAKAAMVVALRKQFPISNLIPVDNAPVDAALKSDFAKYVQGMRKVSDARVTKQSEADKILAEFESSLPVRQFILTNLARDKEDGIQKFRIPVKILASALDNMADFPFKDPEEARWDGPTLFIRGTKSHYVADEMLPTIGRFFPRFEVKDIECGHWVVSEKPEDFRRGKRLMPRSVNVSDISPSCCRVLTRQRLVFLYPSVDASRITPKISNPCSITSAPSLHGMLPSLCYCD